ncbi:MAG TPA: TonB-dependent receptor [Kofleriaceae bacterium]|nr:TonB-dependent receptor [Kofleriaceae bacterium]
MNRLALGVALVAFAGVARADEPPGRADDSVIDVTDLPPLPEAGDAAVSSATVLAAASVQEDVVVGAAKREQSLGNVASAVTVISGDRIRRFGYRTIGEAVAAVAGAYLVDNRLSYSIGIRGLQVPGDFNTRLLVLVDGASVNEAWGAFAGVGYESIVSIDEVSRIEVIRGPVSSFYGTNAFFGTINIVTKGAAESAPVWGTASINTVNGPQAAAGFAIGDVHRQVRGSVHVMDRIGDTTHLAEVPLGRAIDLKGDGQQAISAGLVGTYDGTFGQIRAYREHRNSPFAPYDTSPFEDPYVLYNTQLLVEGGHTRELSDRWTLTGRVYGNFYKYNDRSPPYQPGTLPPANTIAGPPLDTIGTAQTGGAELRTRYEIVDRGRLGLTAGAEGNLNHTNNISDQIGGEHISNPYTYEVEGTYAEIDAQPVPWFGLTGGARYDVHHDGDTDFRTKLSPRLALFLSQPDHYGLKLLYTEGFRAASSFESHFTDGGDFTANKTINPEDIASLEAIVWAKPLPGLSLRVSGYQWTVNHVIDQGPSPTVDNPNLLQFQDVGSFRSIGVEAEASYRDSRGWYAFAGFDYSKVGEKLKAEGATDFTYGVVPNAPRYTASGGLSTPKLFDRVHASTELMYIGERPTRLAADGGPSPASPAWLGWNATLYAPNVGGFDFTVGVRNILDKRDLLPAPGDYDRTAANGTDVVTVARVPGEGREFYAKIGYSY